jgi:hypothetical protein
MILGKVGSAAVVEGRNSNCLCRTLAPAVEPASVESLTSEGTWYGLRKNSGLGLGW